MNAGRPRYRELPDGCATGVFGADDALGCLNLLTPARTAAAAGLVVTGDVFSLNASLNWPNPPFAPDITERRPPEHVVLRRPTSRDERLNGFYPQSSTQWDGFLHVMDPERGCFYNGNTDESRGMHLWAERGIAGRGVLLDVGEWCARRGSPIDWRSSAAISASDLEQCAAEQGVDVSEGTILLVRTGWKAAYDASSWAERVEVSRSPSVCPGLERSLDVAELLWDWGVAAVAADNFALESFPASGDVSLHVELLARLGIPIGEFWALDDLAAACAADRRYEFLVTSAPLHIVGGIGSTANALAIR
jgi:kynurenine formamidase